MKKIHFFINDAFQALRIIYPITRKEKSISNQLEEHNYQIFTFSVFFLLQYIYIWKIQKLLVFDGKTRLSSTFFCVWFLIQLGTHPRLKFAFSNTWTFSQFLHFWVRAFCYMLILLSLWKSHMLLS